MNPQDSLTSRKYLTSGRKVNGLNKTLIKLKTSNPSSIMFIYYFDKDDANCTYIKKKTKIVRPLKCNKYNSIYY